MNSIRVQYGPHRNTQQARPMCRTPGNDPVIRACRRRSSGRWRYPASTIVHAMRCGFVAAESWEWLSSATTSSSANSQVNAPYLFLSEKLEWRATPIENNWPFFIKSNARVYSLVSFKYWVCVAHICWIAPKFDPGFALNFDPLNGYQTHVVTNNRRYSYLMQLPS